MPYRGRHWKNPNAGINYELLDGAGSLYITQGSNTIAVPREDWHRLERTLNQARREE